MDSEVPYSRGLYNFHVQDIEHKMICILFHYSLPEIEGAIQFQSIHDQLVEFMM